MTPQRGALHPLRLVDGAGRRVRTLATYVAVISDDAWNRSMNTVVGVPVLPGPAAVRMFHVEIPGVGYADASRVQSFAATSLGDDAFALDDAVTREVAQAAVAYLGLDDLVVQRVRRPPRMPTGCGAQKGIYWTDLGLDERKRVLVVSPDERNATAPYVTAAYVTSRDKQHRRAWQVPAGGGWVVTGDLLVLAHRALVQRSRPRPSRATGAEMAEVADGIRAVLAPGRSAAGISR